MSFFRNGRRGNARSAEAEAQRALQDLWLATLQRSWRSLALIPLHPGGSVRRLATSLADLASRYRGHPVDLVVCSGLTLESVAKMVDSIQRHHQERAARPNGGQQVIVALEPLVDNPFGLPVVLTADMAILVAELGVTDVRSAERTVEMIGREKILGVVAMK